MKPHFGQSDAAMNKLSGCNKFPNAGKGLEQIAELEAKAKEAGFETPLEYLKAKHEEVAGMGLEPGFFERNPWAIRQMRPAVNMADHPLQAKIEEGQLVIRVGVKRLADCSTGDDLGALHGRKITDPEEFCEDVIREMMIEDEQGTTPLIQFLGEMEIAAFESGSLAIEP